MRITVELHRPTRSFRMLLMGIVGLALIAGPALVLASHQFTDVPNSQPFHADIGAIKDAGITGGCSATTYCPADTVKRDAMAAFMHRGFGRAGMATQTSSISTMATSGRINIVSLQVTVPGVTGVGATQFVSVTGVLTQYGHGVTGCPCEVDYYLKNETTGISGPALYFLQGAADMEGGSHPISWVFAAAPGVHTYTLVAQVWDATSNLSIDYSTIVAETSPFGPTGGSTAASTLSQPAIREGTPATQVAGE